jgi:hypothetical protein
MNEVQYKTPVSYSAMGTSYWLVGDRMSVKTEILLIGVPCKVCEYCCALAFKALKDELFITAVNFSHVFIPKSLK